MAHDRPKCLFLVYQTCLVTPTVIDMNPVEQKYYPFMMSLNQCNERWNVLSAKTFVPKETKDINFKAFNTIANKNKTKTLREHISCNCKCKFNSTICNSKQT